MTIFKDMLRYLRSRDKLSQAQLAEKLGIAKSTVSMYEVGKREPDFETLELIADYFNVDMNFLLGQYGTENNALLISQDITNNTINVFNRIPPNTPIETIDDIISTEIISEQLACTGDFFALKIHGDSMEPRILENDILIIHKQNDAESGDLIIVSVNDNNAICKKLIKYEHGISLVSLNSKYEPEYFSNNEIINKSIKILGKVVEFRAKFN